MQVQFLGWEDPLEEGMATHSSILAWRIPWTEEPGGLQSTGSQSDTTEVTQHIYINSYDPHKTQGQKEYFHFTDQESEDLYGRVTF